MAAANFSKTLNDWLDANDARLRGDAKVMTGKAWRDRGEVYGETAVLVMLIEGSPLYAALNYGEPTWDLHTELNAARQTGSGSTSCMGGLCPSTRSMPKPTTAKTHPHFATYRDTEEWMDNAKKLAADRGGISISALLRALVREEWSRLQRRKARTQEPEDR